MSKESTYFYSIVVMPNGSHALRSEYADYGTYKTKEEAEAALQRVLENKTYYYNEKGKEINV